MLRKTSDLTGFGLQATDGEIGHVHDFYFDDHSWQIRYMVAKTGPWLFGREVLVAASVLEEPRWYDELLPVRLTQEQIKESPDINLAEPISHQHELDMYDHYRWPLYWAPMPSAAGIDIGGMPVAPVSGETSREAEIRRIAERRLEEATHNLRSSNEVTGYHIHATDDEIGHVDDFFVDENDWTIRYLLIDTSNWLPGRRVLIAPSWVERFSWDEQEVYVNVSRAQVENSPEYNPSATITREFERDLHTYYDYPTYWGV